MKRLSLLNALLLLALACQDLATPPVDGPNLDLSDGASLFPGNPDFFFLPPAVPDPSNHPNFDASEFNPNLMPRVEICEMRSNGWGCVKVNGQPLFVARFGPGEPLPVSLQPNSELYVASWDTDDPILEPSKVYRIAVFIGDAFLGEGDVKFYRNQMELQAIDQTEFIPVAFESTLPINFRIENGALCPPGVTRCASGTVMANEGGSVQLNDGTGVNVPGQGGSFPGGINEVTVTVQPCQTFSDLPIDLPTFSECIDITATPVLQGPLSIPAIVFVCDVLTGLSPAQEDLVTVHRLDDQSGQLTALPHALGNCPGEQLAVEQPRGITKLARAIWRAVGGPLATVTTPETLNAAAVRLDRGRGGSSPGFSSFQFALPAKMEILEGDGQSAPAGSAVPTAPAVKITDLNGDPVDDVRLSVEVLTGGGTVVPMTIFSGDDGVARVQSWTLGQIPGANSMRMVGRGLATPAVNGPRPNVFDPFIPIQIPNDPSQEIPAMVSTGEIVFNASGTGQ